MWRGKIRHTIWLTLDDTIKYNEIAKRIGIAPNRIQAEILSKALHDCCPNCTAPRLVCKCTVHTCRQCQKQFMQGWDERFCSPECAITWWNTIKE
jgi:hypothetical protein